MHSLAVDCMRREELVKRKHMAERERGLAMMRAAETEAVRTETKMKVSSKKAQEEELMVNYRRVRLPICAYEYT